MGKRSAKNWLAPSLAALLMLAPLWSLLFFESADSENIDPSLLLEAGQNTLLLGVGVLFLTTLVGYGSALAYFFFDFWGRSRFKFCFLLPLSLPAYVLGFIYLGLSFDWMSSWVSLQGELWFLITVLSIALTPYVFFFSLMGLRSISQCEWETHLLLGGTSSQFFLQHIWPKSFPFVLSGQVLVLFECLSDFGAASMINVPVMTTMIYKLWFDLFSFSGAVNLALRYSLVVFLIVVLELWLGLKQNRQSKNPRTPLRPRRIAKSFEILLLLFFTAYLSLSFVLPVSQLLLWISTQSFVAQLSASFTSFITSLLIATASGVLVVFFGLLIHWRIYHRQGNHSLWSLLSSVGYSVPGSILAVAVHGILLVLMPHLGFWLLVSSLVLSLAYKFLTVAMRPIGETYAALPRELWETGQIMGVSAGKQWISFYWPYLRSTAGVAFCLVVIEVIKEMPLTLMLAPGGLRTLSIDIFNYTSEGEWEKAALPSLLLIVFSLLSIVFLGKEQSHDS